MQLWVLPEVRALTGAELEASSLEEPEEDAEEAQADAAAADKAEEVRAGSAPEVTPHLDHFQIVTVSGSLAWDGQLSEVSKEKV